MRFVCNCFVTLSKDCRAAACVPMARCVCVIRCVCVAMHVFVLLVFVMPRPRISRLACMSCWNVTAVSFVDEACRASLCLACFVAVSLLCPTLTRGCLSQCYCAWRAHDERGNLRRGRLFHGSLGRQADWVFSNGGVGEAVRPGTAERAARACSARRLPAGVRRLRAEAAAWTIGLANPAGARCAKC